MPWHAHLARGYMGIVPMRGHGNDCRATIGWKPMPHNLLAVVMQDQ
jgi:hypothetical protein